jgi:hypothetical protein
MPNVRHVLPLSLLLALGCERTITASSNTESTVTPPGPNQPGGAQPDLIGLEPSPACAGVVYTRLLPVTTAAELATALANAKPGDLIQLADATYGGKFKSSRSGTATARITLCGSRAAVIDGGTMASGNALWIGGSYWTLTGFTITNASVGVVINKGTYDIIDQLSIHHLGTSGIDVRVFSKYNIVRNSELHDLGLATAKYGEGVYLGSANGAWASRTAGQPDRSDSNQVVNNVIGPNVTGEHVDVKEGTTGGIITGNSFDGTGMTAAYSWIDVKGNEYVVSGNTGTTSRRDGFQVHVAYAGWGQNTVFHGNTADVRNLGYGFRVAVGALGNVVGCDNTVTNALAGFANVACQ